MGYQFTAGFKDPVEERRNQGGVDQAAGPTGREGNQDISKYRKHMGRRRALADNGLGRAVGTLGRRRRRGRQ